MGYFLWDKNNSKLKRVSLTADGKERNQGNESANRIVSPAISGNGRYIAFTTTATNMITGDVNAFHTQFSGILMVFHYTVVLLLLIAHENNIFYQFHIVKREIVAWHIEKGLNFYLYSLGYLQIPHSCNFFRAGHCSLNPGYKKQTGLFALEPV